MKTLFKVILSIVIAVAASLLVRYSYLTVAEASDDTTSSFDNELIRTREMFVEKADDIQTLTAALVDMPLSSVLRAADGTARIVRDNNADTVFKLDDETAQKALDSVFGTYLNGGSIINIEITKDAVLFYTYYNDNGYAGLIYEKEAGTTNYYEYYELIENWKLFFHFSDA